MLIKKIAPLIAVIAAGVIAVAVAQASTSPSTKAGVTTQVVTHQVASPGTVGTRSGTASCPSGSHVTGGGYDAPYGGTQTEVANRPQGNGWHVRILSTGSITVYADCVSFS
jgi:hypothetical protein